MTSRQTACHGGHARQAGAQGGARGFAALPLLAPVPPTFPQVPSSQAVTCVLTFVRSSATVDAAALTWQQVCANGP